MDALTTMLAAFGKHTRYASDSVEKVHNAADGPYGSFNNIGAFLQNGFCDIHAGERNKRYDRY